MARADSDKAYSLGKKESFNVPDISSSFISLSVKQPGYYKLEGVSDGAG